MKKNILILSVVAFIAVGFASCSKYEEGPNISFRSKEARLTNNWGIESVTINGVEQAETPFYAKQKHYIYPDGSYRITIIDPVTLEAENVQGNWTMYDKGRRLSLVQNTFAGIPDTTVDYKILKLFEQQLWIRSADNAVEYHFVPYDEKGKDE